MGCGQSSESMEPDMPQEESAPAASPPPNYRPQRRKSVSAESSSNMVATERKVVPKSDEEKETIRASTRRSFLFADLEDDQMNEVVDAMFQRVVYEGDVIIKEGEDGDNFYIIEQGTFVASKGGTEVHKYEGEGAFGELALMYNCPRAATCTAASDGKLWCVDRVTFRSILIVGTQQKREKYEATLRGMALFSGLDKGEISVIADCLTPELYVSGDVILKQGDPLDEAAKFYIVESGKVECIKDGKVVKTVEPGGYFGELALIEKQPRAADVTAREPKTKVLSMQRSAFERLMGPVEQTLGQNIEEYKKVNAGTV